MNTKLLSIAFLISLLAGLNPADAQPAPARRPSGASGAAHARSELAGLCHGEGIARRHCAAGGRRRKLHHRPDSRPRAGNGRADKRAARNRLRIHHEFGGQQDLSRHCARTKHVGTPDTNNPARLIVTTSHPDPTRAAWRCMFPGNTFPGQPRHSLSGRTDPTESCSRLWII